MTLQVIVHEAEEGGCWAEVPSLPGCASQGETLEELEFNIKDAITDCRYCFLSLLLWRSNAKCNSRGNFIDLCRRQHTDTLLKTEKRNRPDLKCVGGGRFCQAVLQAWENFRHPGVVSVPLIPACDRNDDSHKKFS